MTELRQCVVQYEWSDSLVGSSREPRRLLFGWSGNVRAEDHLAALTQVCPIFQPERDLLGMLSLEKLEQALQEASREGRPFGALHLLCHGSRAPDGSYGLDLNAPRGGHEVIDARKLRAVIGPHARTLRLVVLCMCYGNYAGPLGSPLGSVAFELHRLGIPAVIGSRAPLSMRGSTRFTEELYRALFERGASVQEAFQVARTAPEASSMDRLVLQLYPAALAAALGAAINLKTQPGLVLHNYRKNDGGCIEVYRFDTRAS